MPWYANLEEDECKTREILRTVSMVNAAIPTQLVAYLESVSDETNFSDYMLLLLIIVTVPHRSTGEEVRVTFWYLVPKNVVLDSVDSILRWVRDRVQATWMHELDEAMYVDGSRYRDPHTHT